MCPSLKTIVRSFIVITQRWHDQFLDILLMDWRWDKQKSETSTFRFQLVWGLHACGHIPSLIINISCLEGVLVSTKDFGVSKALPQGCTIVSLDCFSLVAHPFPPSVSNCLNVPLGTYGGWMKATSCNQRNGGHRKSLCPGALQVTF